MAGVDAEYASGVSSIDPIVQYMLPCLKEKFSCEKVVLFAVNGVIWTSDFEARYPEP